MSLLKLDFKDLYSLEFPLILEKLYHKIKNIRLQGTQTYRPSYFEQFF